MKSYYFFLKARHIHWIVACSTNLRVTEADVRGVLKAILFSIPLPHMSKFIKLLSQSQTLKSTCNELKQQNYSLNAKWNGFSLMHGITCQDMTCRWFCPYHMCCRVFFQEPRFLYDPRTFRNICWTCAEHNKILIIKFKLDLMFKKAPVTHLIYKETWYLEEKKLWQSA